MLRIVLAHSGGLETSVAIPWLADRYHAEIVTVTLDLGRGRALEDVRDRALALGGARAHVLDVRDEFAREYILPALKAHAIDESGDPMAAALSRPLIARKLIEIANIEHTTAIAHGCASSGTDPIPLEVAISTLDPRLEIIALPATAAGESRVDPIGQRPDEPALIDLAFDRGVPTAVNGVAMPLSELIDSLTTVAGRRAVIVLYTAHHELRRLVTTSDLERVFALVSLEYAAIVHDGKWFTPLRAALDRFVEDVEARVTGVVRLRLFKGECRLVGSSSPFALDDHARAGHDAGDLFARLAAGDVAKMLGLVMSTTHDQ